MQQLRLLGVLSANEITEPFRKIKKPTRTNVSILNGLYGYIQPSNLSSALQSIEGKALLEHIITFWSNNLMTCYGEEAQTTCFSH